MGARFPTLKEFPQRGAVFCAALLLCACAEFGAAPGGGPGDAREQRLRTLEQRVEALTQAVEGVAASPQGEVLVRLEAEMRSLRGEMERLRYDVDAADKRSREWYEDVDRRLAGLERGGAAQATSGPAAAAQEEEAAYTAVFEQLRARKYDESIAGFRRVLEQWPQGRFADNAWYWLGEAHYAKNEVVLALEAFRTLLARFPASAKAPDALFKVGVCQADQKQPGEARASWEKVIAKYPQSPAAALARERLQAPR